MAFSVHNKVHSNNLTFDRIQKKLFATIKKKDCKELPT